MTAARLAWRHGHVRRRQACRRCGTLTRSTQATGSGRWPKCSRCAPLTATERLILAVFAGHGLTLVDLRERRRRVTASFPPQFDLDPRNTGLLM